MPHDIRSELSALQDELRSEADTPLQQSASPDHTDAPTKEKWADIENVLHELQKHMADAASDAETIVAEHPFAAIGAAFILGVMAGRMVGTAR